MMSKGRCGSLCGIIEHYIVVISCAAVVNYNQKGMMCIYTLCRWNEMCELSSMKIIVSISRRRIWQESTYVLSKVERYV